MVEGKRCSVSARRIEFKKGELRKDPITDQNMVLYELDRNCSVEVTDALVLFGDDMWLRIVLGVHWNVGDRIWESDIYVRQID